MSLSVRRIRQRVQDAIAAAMGPGSTVSPPWHASRYAWPIFPGSGDTRKIVTRAYAVGIVGTEVDPRSRQHRGTAGDDALATTTVSVRYTCSLRADGHVGDYDAALDHEADLVEAVLTMSADPDLNIRLSSIQARDVIADGTIYVGDLRFAVLHGYPLDGAPDDG